jgi:hypothetical protein
LDVFLAAGFVAVDLAKGLATDFFVAGVDLDLADIASFTVRFLTGALTGFAFLFAGGLATCFLAAGFVTEFAVDWGVDFVGALALDFNFVLAFAISHSQYLFRSSAGSQTNPSLPVMTAFNRLRQRGKPIGFRNIYLPIH